MEKILKNVLVIAILSLAILFLGQTKVGAETNNISTMEELKTVFKEKAIIDGNTIKLINDVTLEDALYIKIPELVIDFNGKTIECKENGSIYVCNKVTFKDASNTDRLKWGGIIFNVKNLPSIEVKEGAELIINNGKFVDGGANTHAMMEVLGKLTINDATFSSNRTKIDPGYIIDMIKLRENSETIINDGNFSHVATIINVVSNIADYNNAKLTINGGNFKSTEEIYGTINISSCRYPYVNENNNKKIITPTIVLNNCNVEGKHIALSFSGGSVDEEYKNADTKILTILGGTYTTSEKGIAAFHISTQRTYFNPKDVVLQNATFESKNKRRNSNTIRWSRQTVNTQRFVIIS